MVFGNLFTLGCEADNRVATTPIMSKIEAVWRMFRFFGCIVVFFLCFFWARYNFQRLCATWRSQFGVKPMFSIAQAHPKLGWVGQVWILSVVVPLSSGDQKKYVQMTSKGGSRLGPQILSSNKCNYNANINAQKILLYCLFYCQMHGIYAALFPQYDNKLEAVQGSRNSLFWKSGWGHDFS